MKTRAAVLMLLPATAFFLLSFVAPIVFVSRMSLFKTDFLSWVFVGIGNYTKAFHDSYFLRSFVNAGYYIVFVAGGLPIVSYFAASVIVDMHKRFQAAMIFAFYAPTLASGIIMSMMYKFLFRRTGLVNYLLSLVGIGAVGWFADGLTAKAVISLTMIAGSLGGYTLIYYANMLSIPGELMDQAAIDGASRRQIKRRIILPLMTPTIVLISLLTMLAATQMMETVMWLTDGGPAGRTATPVYDVYRTGFLYGDYGLASAKALVVMAFVVIVTLVKRRVEKWSIK